MGLGYLNFSFGGATGRAERSLGEVRERFADECEAAAEWLAKTPASADGHGWILLPDGADDAVKETANWLNGYEAIVQVGIGGSALGNLMLNQAMLGDYFNERGASPRFYMADNPDPTKALAIWERVRNGSVALVGVSKSGATAETMSQFLWFRKQMSEAGHDVNGDTLVITDPENGVFRAFAKETGCRSLDFPPSVGGRYSVLSSAGLTCACALGIDIDGLLLGARRMRDELFRLGSIESNPAWTASALHCFHEESGRPMSVVMPYSSRLACFAEWYAQLWGESLGKRGKGTTPVRALGAVDQHSQVQLYTEGPDDKLFTIINLKRHGASVTVPECGEKSLAPLSYMRSADIGRMLGLEAMSTAAAIARAGKPVIWMYVERLDAQTLGALIFYYEYVTAITGRMMGVNPFDQPGVEQGKRYTYGLMGRAGYEGDAKEAMEWFGRLNSELVTL